MGFECRRCAITMLSEGAFSIFYCGCKQSNLSTHAIEHSSFRDTLCKGNSFFVYFV